jgi:N-acetylneuraminic acid mutarotase
MDASAAVLGERRLFVYGGICGHRMEATIYLSTIECYDLTLGQWEVLPHMQQPRACAAMVAAASTGHVYVCGGRVDTGALRSVEQFDPETGTWQTLPGMPHKCFGATASIASHELYICGGRNHVCNSKYVQHLSLDSLEWATLPPMARPHFAESGAVVFALPGDGYSLAL